MVPQAFKHMNHKGGGNYRRYEIDERHSKRARNHHAAEKDTPGQVAANLSGRVKFEPP